MRHGLDEVCRPTIAFGLLAAVALAGSFGATGCVSGGGDADLGDDAADLSDAELELAQLINAERSSRGLPAVTVRADLNCAAQRHSDDIGTGRRCSHDGSDGSTPTTRVAECGGAGWSGEIIACGQGTPRAAVDAWLNSDGHRQIMLTREQKTVGVAVHNNYWTAIFDQ